LLSVGINLIIICIVDLKSRFELENSKKRGKHIGFGPVLGIIFDRDDHLQSLKLGQSAHLILFNKKQHKKVRKRHFRAHQPSSHRPSLTHPFLVNLIDRLFDMQPRQDPSILIFLAQILYENDQGWRQAPWFLGFFEVDHFWGDLFLF
jgi:hypothetical protein